MNEQDKKSIDNFTLIGLMLVAFILIGVILANNADNKIEQEGNAIKYCETLQLADGTIVDRPCAPNEQPKNSVRAQQLPGPASFIKR